MPTEEPVTAKDLHPAAPNGLPVPTGRAGMPNGRRTRIPHVTPETPTAGNVEARTVTGKPGWTIAQARDMYHRQGYSLAHASEMSGFPAAIIAAPTTHYRRSRRRQTGR